MKTIQMIILSSILTFFTSTGMMFVLCDYYKVDFKYDYTFYMIGALMLFALIKGGSNGTDNIETEK